VGLPAPGRRAVRAGFPADFISEAIDQTRGWFYSLLMISTLLFDERLPAWAPWAGPALQDLHGARPRVRQDGKKESKSKGNYTPPIW
jgi:isoleucyl-tRNA synthetase